MTTVLLMLAVIFWGFLVLRASNAVHSVLSLVLVFAFTALLFLQLGAEFFALLLFTVYIGAIAILFLFVIMMLDLRRAELHGSAYYHVPLGASLGLAFLLVLSSFLAPQNVATAPYSLDLWLITPQSNLKILGQVLYNYYAATVLVITLILLLAMVAVIAITLEEKPQSPATSSAPRFSRANIFWSTIQQCSKGPELSRWWDPFNPSLQTLKKQALVSWWKWPHHRYTN